MGRGKFGGGPGPWGDEQWRGWWGEDPPFHKPVFVLTHHEREPLTLSDTTFTFVTDGIEAALDQVDFSCLLIPEHVDARTYFPNISHHVSYIVSDLYHTVLLVIPGLDCMYFHHVASFNLRLSAWSFTLISKRSAFGGLLLRTSS